jgi:group I intron endonuclease
MDIFTVYKITCLINKKVYIGYTKKSIQTRLKGHFKTAIKNKKENKNHKFSNAILKYGQINFTIESIFKTNDKSEALLKEIYFINLFNLTKKGYNTSIGGEGGAVKGRKLSQTHKEKIRVAHLGKKLSDETKLLISKNHCDVSKEKNPFFGKKHNEETKKKIGNREYKKGCESHLFGIKTKTAFKEGFNHPKSQPITINGVEFGSLTLAAKSLGVSRDTIKKKYLMMN